jgi:hypothetical protein
MNTTSTNPKSNPPQNILSRLQDYMFTENLINQTLENRLIQTEIPIKNNKNMYSKQSPNKEINSMFVPKQKDSLFWCFYIIMNGQYKYDMLEHINVVIEKKLKIEYIEKIRKEKQIVKKYKFATLTHLETVLANEDKIDLSTFLTMCVIEGINILYICKKTYFELLMNDDSKNYVIQHLDKNKYGYEELIVKSKFDSFKANLFQIDNIDKPVKSISSYKVSELIDFCNKLGIEIINKDNKSKSKKDLYESLIQYF